MASNKRKATLPPAKQAKQDKVKKREQIIADDLATTSYLVWIRHQKGANFSLSVTRQSASSPLAEWSELTSHSDITIEPSSLSRAVKYSLGDIVEIRMDGDENSAHALIVDIKKEAMAQVQNASTPEVYLLVAWFYPKQDVKLAHSEHYTWPEGQLAMLSTHFQVLFPDCIVGKPLGWIQRVRFAVDEQPVATWIYGKEMVRMIPAVEEHPIRDALAWYHTTEHLGPLTLSQFSSDSDEEEKGGLALGGEKKEKEEEIWQAGSVFDEKQDDEVLDGEEQAGPIAGGSSDEEGVQFDIGQVGVEAFTVGYSGGAILLSHDVRDIVSAGLIHLP